jgi:GNAT superfamily N-acetyltransferase
MSLVVSRYDPAISYQGQKQFDCGHKAINDFVHKGLKAQVKKNLSVAYVLTDPAQGDRFAGFYTIAQHTISLSLLSAMELSGLPKTIPCTRLIMLGVDDAYAGQQMGSRLMKHALILTRATAAHVGSFGMYLDADPGAFGFYGKLGFIALEGNRAPRTSPMFLPLSAIP